MPEEEVQMTMIPSSPVVSWTTFKPTQKFLLYTLLLMGLGFLADLPEMVLMFFGRVPLLNSLPLSIPLLAIGAYISSSFIAAGFSKVRTVLMFLLFALVLGWLIWPTVSAIGVINEHTAMSCSEDTDCTLYTTAGSYITESAPTHVYSGPFIPIVMGGSDFSIYTRTLKNFHAAGANVEGYRAVCRESKCSIQSAYGTRDKYGSIPPPSECPSDPELAAMCLYDNAEQSHDFSLCAQISTTGSGYGLRTECYTLAAEVAMDPSKCNLLTHREDMDVSIYERQKWMCEQRAIRAFAEGHAEYPECSLWLRTPVTSENFSTLTSDCLGVRQSS